LSGYKYDEKGKVTEKGEVLHWYYEGTGDYINEFEVNPYEKDANGKYIHTFMPNVCINFSTGQMWLSTGRIQFGKLNDRNVSTTDEMQTADNKVRSEFTVADNAIKGMVETLKTDVNGKITTIQNSILTDEKVSALISQALIDGNVVTKAEIATFITEDEAGKLISNATISADKVKIGGNVNINNILTVDENVVTMSNANIKNCSITDVVVKGSLRSPFAQQGDAFVIGGQNTTSDNIVPLSDGSGGWAQMGALDWDVSQSGRRMTLVHYKWKNVTATGSITYQAPEGKYFFEDGLAKKEITLSRECVDILGYGAPKTKTYAGEFYGWIVLRRINMMTNAQYGKELRVLAVGQVTVGGTNDSPSISTLSRAVDGTALSASFVYNSSNKRQTGKYQINLPSSWALQSGKYMVIATGIGNVLGNTKEAVVKATAMNLTPTSFQVWTSDDASLNHGSFSFMIINLNDWMYL
jgi:hypothetical protein